MEAVKSEGQVIEPGEIKAKKKKLVGHTKPRLNSPLLKGKSLGHEVVELAEKIGMPLMPWQKFIFDDMLKIDAKGNFRRKTIGILVARQNGKTHLAAMRIIWGLLRGEQILALSSNRAKALDTFQFIADIIARSDFLSAELQGKPRLANGQESIKFKSGGQYRIAAATRDGTRGFSADLLYVDELREITPDSWTAMRPVTRAKPNAQTLTTSNAGDAFSEVLNDFRNRALEHPSETFGWYEYSAPANVDVWDRNAWCMANPALSFTITEDVLEEAVATNTIEATKTETLCVWIDSLQSPWPYGSIEATSLSDLQLPPGKPTIFAFDISPSRRQGTLVAAQMMDDGITIGVGLMQIWQSEVGIDDLKMAAEINDWAKKYRPTLICYDKYATQSIADKLQQSGWPIQDVSGQRFYQACGELLDYFTNTRLLHSGQPELVASFNNCAMKVNDAGWRIVRRKSAGDVTAAIGVAMCVHILSKPVPKAAIISV